MHLIAIVWHNINYNNMFCCNQINRKVTEQMAKKSPLSVASVVVDVVVVFFFLMQSSDWNKYRNIKFSHTISYTCVHCNSTFNTFWNYINVAAHCTHTHNNSARVEYLHTHTHFN